MRPSELDIARWDEIDALFETILDVPEAERETFLAATCRGDEELKTEVQALLRALDVSGDLFDGTVDTLLIDLPMEFGPFRVIREIGRGGMGVVFLAEDTRLGRRVALKVLPPVLGLDEEARHRFVAEAKAVSSLDHPSIATLHETDVTDDGRHYMAFAYYEGETIGERLERGPLSVPEALTITAHLARGLAAAHERGIIHRDIKPSNVLLTTDGAVKLLDFGVAKVVGGRATQDGLRLGTVAYMSPEQVDGDEVDARTDLWSIGVLLFEMLTGRAPFEGPNRAALLQAILNGPIPDLAAHAGEIPETVESILATLLVRRRDDRYASANELLRDLDAVRAGDAPEIASSRSRSGIARFLVSFVVVAIVALGVWLIAGRPSSRVRTLAVLPFADRSASASGPSLVSGMHDALVSDLGTIGSVSVMSRASTSGFVGSELPPSQIGRALEVDAVLAGAMDRSGDRVAVTMELVGTESGRVLWADSFRYAIADLYALSKDAARSIVEGASIEVASDEAVRLASVSPVNPEAYDAYLLGRFNLELRTPEGFQQAQAYLRRAIEIDPLFVPAYTELAEAFGSAAFFGLVDPSVAMPRVLELAERALEIDSTSAEGHMLLAGVRLYWDWDWDGAEREARRAVAANPSLSRGYGMLSEVLAVQGRYEASLAAVERRTELDRLVPFSAFRPAVVHYYMRDFDEAINQTRSGLEFFADFWQGHWLLCVALSGDGRPDEAIPSCEEASRLSRRTPMAVAALGHVYGRTGRTDDAVGIVRELTERSETTYVGATHLALVHAGIGDRDRAFDSLARAVARRNVSLVHLRNQVLFDTIRPDPRFDSLALVIGIPDRPPGGGE